MTIRDWTEKQINNLIANYDRLGQIEGGRFSRAQAVLELERRRGGDFDGREAAQLILSMHGRNPGKAVTYGAIWNHYFPDRAFVGNHSQQIVGQILHAAAYYCAVNGLPIVTAIVCKANGQITDQAKSNMYAAGEAWGINVGKSPEDFYRSNIERISQLDPNELP